MTFRFHLQGNYIYLAHSDVILRRKLFSCLKDLQGLWTWQPYGGTPLPYQDNDVTLKIEVSDPHDPAAACTGILQSTNCHLEVNAVSTAGSFFRACCRPAPFEATCLYIDDPGSVSFLGVGWWQLGRVRQRDLHVMRCTATVTILNSHKSALQQAVQNPNQQSGHCL